MKDFLHNASGGLEKNVFAKVVNFFKGMINNHPEMFAVLFLFFMCLLFLFFGLNFYPLIDVDETRYAVIAKNLIGSRDWNSLILNYEPFLEKPPLYFWLVAASVKFFGGLSAFAIRFPMAILASFLTFFTYFFGKKVISRKFGIVSALVLLTSIFFLILSHVAILDIVVTVFVASALYCGALTNFCDAGSKKYYWFYFYLFMGLGVLAKGILAFVLPLFIIFSYFLVTKNLKEMFKPMHILPGIIVFLAIILPWHTIMYLEYGNTFVKEYFLLHHFARFIDSANIGRERPFLYFVPVFLLGFLPWTLVFIAAAVRGFNKLADKFESLQGDIKSKILALTEVETNEQKLLLFAWLYFILGFLFFSFSSTKLPTYILPVFPAAALITGHFWWKNDEKFEDEKAIGLCTKIISAVFIITALVLSIGYFFLPPDIKAMSEHFKSIAVNGTFLLSIFLLLRLDTKRSLSIFSGYVFLMLFIISLGVSCVFNFVYQFGQNELVSYASTAQDGVSQLVTFDFAVKPSVMTEYKNKVEFITDPDFEVLDEKLKFRGAPTFVIVKNKSMEDNIFAKKIKSRLELITEGKKYSLYVKDVNNKYKDNTRFFAIQRIGMLDY
ncbi:MAG TPA: glycosyltransferase family 39 protein [Candidatus Gastranaerophilaceae bacterium]|nr:glycosyltransferase family 39 protein [Candidatus Gastranaerophilaceae bacterium]HPT41719.1 glycosyltransferase family 39 protein [Candidatus Gastranaerophilaceae bacterium]